MNDIVSIPTKVHQENIGHIFNKNAARKFVEWEYEKLIEIMDINPQVVTLLNLVDNLEIGNNIKKTLKSKLYDFLSFHQKTLGIIPAVESLELFPIHDNLPEDTSLYSIGKINIWIDNSNWKTGHGAIIRIASHSEYLFIRVKNQAEIKPYLEKLVTDFKKIPLRFSVGNELKKKLHECIKQYMHTDILSQSTWIELIPAHTIITSSPKEYNTGNIKLTSIKNEKIVKHWILLTIDENNPSLVITIASINQDL